MNRAAPRKDALIFDLDGTLVDTLGDIATAINLTRAKYGFEQWPAADITRQVGDGTEFLVRRTVPVPEAQFEEAHAAYHAYYDAHMLDQSRAYEGVEAILSHFSGRTLGVVTNKPQRQTDKLLDALGLRGRFAMVLGGDALPRKKPDPLPLHHFLSAHGLAPAAAVMVGDGVNDVRAGKAAGLLTVGVTYGVATRDQLLAEGADALLDRMADLPMVVA